MKEHSSTARGADGIGVEICWNTVPLLEGQMGLVSRYIVHTSLSAFEGVAVFVEEKFRDEIHIFVKMEI